MEWAEVMCCSASAVSSGKPTTTPSATMTSETRSPRAGRFSRKTTSRASASKPAMAARATVRNTGSNSSTATRVAGSDPLKISTPMNPLIHPLVVLSMPISVSHLYRTSRHGHSSYNAVQFDTNCYGWMTDTDGRAVEDERHGDTRSPRSWRAIRQRIAARSLTPGAKLPSIRAFAATMQVSDSDRRRSL